MALTSIGLGQTCSSSTLPRLCARTSFIRSIKSAPKAVFFALVFLGILLRSLQMSCDLPQLLSFLCGQIRFYVLGVAPHQVNAGGNHDVQVDDPGTAALSLGLCCP